MQTAEEPFVNVGHLVDLVDRVAAVEGSRDGENALVGGVDELLVNVLNKIVLQQISQRSIPTGGTGKNTPQQTH